MRLDLQVARAFGMSREKAKELILANLVCVDGKSIAKPSFDMSAHMDSKITLLSHKHFLSRGASKLYNFLESARLLDVFSGKSVLDVGSSTGGFASVALELDAESVTCVDVGSNQLDGSLRGKVALHENTDIRDFECDGKFDLLTCDVSFISIKKIFPFLCKFSREMILLFKPQFEVGKSFKRNSRGVLLEGVDGALLEFRSYLEENCFGVLDSKQASPKGKEGNVEYFFHIKRF